MLIFTCPSENSKSVRVGWMELTRWCPCQKFITSLCVNCSSCRGAHSEISHRRAPIADGLPPPPGPKPEIAIRLMGPSVQQVPADHMQCPSLADEACHQALLELCRVNVPIIKYLPGPAASPFTKAWERLFFDAYTTRSLASWRACFMFPKAVLLAPARMGKSSSSGTPSRRIGMGSGTAH